MGLWGWRRSAQERFGRDVLRVVQATGKVSSARYDNDEFVIVYRLAEDDSEGRIFLHNTFHETADAGRRERTERVRRLVDAVIGARGAKETWQQARPNLRPVLRGVSFGAGTAVGDATLVSRPALPYLQEAVVVDRPTSMAYVTRALLAEWGVSAEEVFATARANVAVAARRIAASADRRPTLHRFIDSGDAYFTSMLLVDGFLAGMARQVGGRPVAFVPDRDTLIVTGEASPGLAELYAMVEEEYSQATRSISPAGYTTDDRGAVVPYQAPPHSALARVVHRAEVVLAAGEYAAQKVALDAAHERDGTDIFVASLLAFGRSDQSLVSLAVWPMDVDTLLPQADLVAFQASPDDDGTLMVPFDVVAREAVLVAEPDYDPPRFRVTAWPDEPVMARIRAQAVGL